MKFKSIQFKFLITVISAMLAITVFIGGLSIYEVDQFVQLQTEDFINVTCEKDASQINDVFGDMEKAVHIMKSYVYGLIQDYEDIVDPQRQVEIMDKSDEMFVDVAKNTDEAVAYYLRFAPEVSHSTCGFFYSKENSEGEFVRFETTDLSLYDKSDTEHVGWYWQPYEAGKAIWMMPYYNQNNNVLMISYVVPLFFDNEFFGVVGMDFDYTVLTDKIHKMKIYENGFAYLEYEGNVIHNENIKIYENTEEYLRVSKELKNGMTLIQSASYDDIRQIRYDIALKILFVVLLLAVIFSLIVIFIVKRIVYPLRTLTDASVKLSNGEYDVEIVHSNTYEINLLSTAFGNMALHLKEHEKMQHLLAYRDSLTGLRNTNSYKAWMTDFDKEIENKEIDFGVIVLDINYLKETNDRYGHDVGNKLIVSAAQVISGIFKRSPVFRIGGDEFLVILQNRDLDDLEELLEKFDEQCLNESVAIDKENIPVSIAKGFARYDSGKDSSFVDVFNRADDVMYENKREIKGLK
jgi:diguanylate cyclase (GGDEF)-like protein